MKKQILLSFSFILFFSVYGQSQNQDQNTEDNLSFIPSSKKIVTTEYLILREKLANKSQASHSSKIYFPKKQNTKVDFSSDWSNKYSFYNPTTGYTIITQKGKPVKGAKLSKVVSHGLNFLLKDN